MSLTTCVRKAGAALAAEDKTAILAAARNYRKGGMGADEAARAAVRDQIAAVDALLAREQPAAASLKDRARAMRPDAVATRDLAERADETANEMSRPPATTRGLQSPGMVQPADGSKETVPNEPEDVKPPPLATKPDRIDDFGEKLAGARKDYAAQLKDAASVDVAAEPLSKSWPEPDYQKLLDGGAHPFVVAFIHAARDEVPTKPQKAWKLKGWVESVRTLRGMAQSLVDGTVPAAKMREALARAEYKQLEREVGGRADLYEAVGHQRSLKGVSISAGSYSVYRGVHYSPAKTMWTVEQRAKSTAFSNWPRELAVGNTRDEALEAFKAKLGTLDLGPDAKRQPQFIIYSKRGQPGAFIGKKIGREYVDLHKADDLKAARAYMAANLAQLEQKLERYRDTPMERRETNLPRVGDDHRNGAPVSPEVFAETFGFRGVQFGNYVEQGRRQSDLNEAYDALMDMAAVLGIPPRAISLNGRLGLAFGARGKGGKNAPAAHYEPDNIVINLTKGGGPGSLGHEWWHSLDNYFGKEFGAGGFVTDGARVDRLRDEMQSAFKAVQRATQAPTLRQRAAALDKRRSKPYWNTPLELSARAFESYLIAKLNDQGAANDYLANVVDEEAWGIAEQARAAFFGGDKEPTYPYPGQAELPAVRAAFDEFFRTVEAREDEAGNVALYSRGGQQATDAEANALRALADNDDLFALPRSNATTVEGIAADIDPRIQVTPHLAEGLDRYTLTLPSGSTAELFVREPSPFGPHSYGNTYDEDNSIAAAETVRPGEDEWNMRQVGDVWINVARLGPGEGGQVVYAIAGDFAHNTGRVFIGDPAGVSDDAMRRRPEAMLSSALRWGTTEHLAPHPRQVAGDTGVGVPGLKWVAGDDLGNIRRLVDLNLQALENAGHDDSGIRFDPATGGFLDSEGRVIDQAGIDAVAGAMRSSADAGGSSELRVRPAAGDAGVRPAGGALVGRRTLARAAVLRALLREESREGAAGGQRDGLLARLAKLAGDRPQELAGLFSKVREVAPRPRRGQPVERVQALVDAIKSRWANAPPVVVVESIDDERVPPKVRQQAQQLQSQGDAGAPDGFFHPATGTVYLIADQLGGDADTLRVLMHESLGHFGLRGVFGAELGALLDRLARLNTTQVRAAAERLGLDYERPAQRRMAAEELLAYMAQNHPELSFVRSAIAAVRSWLREHVPGFDGMEFSDDEIVRNFLLPARDFVKGRGASGAAERAAGDGAVFSRVDHATTEAFKRWFGDSKVVDAEGKPLVVYHGTAKDFSAFDPAARKRRLPLTGMFFTPEHAIADYYALLDGGSARGGGDNVMPVYLSIKNPALLEYSDADRPAPTHWSLVESDIQQAIKDGHDGAIIKGWRDGSGAMQYVAFRPEQIKSAIGNRGTFDPEDQRIAFSRGAAGQRPEIQRKVVNALADMLGSAGAQISWWDKSLGTQYAKAQKHPAFGRVFDHVQRYISETSMLANEAADHAKSILPKLESWRDLRHLGIDEKDAKAIAGPVFTGTLTDKKVYTDAELERRFNLTPKQIGQYREFLAAVNASLDQAVTADVLRMLGDPPAALREKAVADRAGFRRAVLAFLQERVDAGIDPEGSAELLQDIKAKYERIDALKAEGYAPLMRFGRYKVHVVDADGQTLYFGLYETRGAANRMARALGEDPAFKDAKIERGMLSAEQYRLFSAVPLDSMEMFAQAIGADQSEVFQEFIKLAKNNRSALKRLIERKGTAGFSEDVPRVLAAFVTSNARMAAGALNLSAAKEAAAGIREGDVQDEAIKLLEAVQNPNERAGAARGLMYVNFIGGSIASAVVNLTQPLTMTLPYLSQWGGGAKAATRLLGAAKMAATGKGGSLALRAALKRAETDGVVSPQEIHHLTAQAMGTWGTNPWIRRAAFIWGAPFSLAEQFNRRVSFIAAYQTAVEQGIENPEAFAEKAVIETQGLYNAGNAPNLARSAVGASALTFKQFAIHYLEWMQRMYRSGPEGKKAVVLALAMLMVAAGTDGLPFADDIDDLVDTLGQALGYDTNLQRTRRELLAELMGEELADVVARGGSALAGVPIDVSLRMSMGNLIPASGLFLRSNTDRSADVLELAGPAGGLARQYMEAAQKGLRGDLAGAAQSALPMAVQNALRGVEMWSTGEARDKRGRKIMDADELDGLVKLFGFNPQSIARESEKISMIRRSEQLAKNVEGEIAADWARAFADGDGAGIAAARERLADWNEANPDERIVITGAQIARRARELRKERAARFVTSVSKERRDAAREELTK